MKKTLLITVMAVALSACATEGGAPAPAGGGNAAYNDLATQAKNEIALANKSGFTWRDTDKFMKEAEEAQKAGDMDKATKLVKKALKEAQLAQQQAKDNTNAAPRF
jgi:hypothetical protein